MSYLQQTELVNIGNRDRQVRLLVGSISLGVGVVLTAYLIAGGVAVWWRPLVFIPLAIGLSLIMESRRGVCPMLANKGQRNLEGLFASSGDAIEDQALADGIRRVGRTLVAQSLMGAIVLTVIAMLI